METERTPATHRKHSMPPKGGVPLHCQDCIHYDRPACKSKTMTDCQWRRSQDNHDAVK